MSEPVSMKGRVAGAWALVGIPLAYGVFETLRKTVTLFGG
jgi:hypothetical protein